METCCHAYYKDGLKARQDWKRGDHGGGSLTIWYSGTLTLSFQDTYSSEYLALWNWTDAFSHTVHQGKPLTGHFWPVHASPCRKSIHQFAMFSAWASLDRPWCTVCENASHNSLEPITRLHVNWNGHCSVVVLWCCGILFRGEEGKGGL